MTMTKRTVLLAFLFGLVVAMASSFVVTTPSTRRATAQMATRRDVLGLAVVGILAAAAAPIASPSHAFTQQLDENIVEPSQQATGGKVDVNGAFVGEYKQFPGMFPTAAGKIASHGPYRTVKDIYKIPNLTPHDVQMFQKYERELTANPPGRMFNERINNRVST